MHEPKATAGEGKCVCPLRNSRWAGVICDSYNGEDQHTPDACHNPSPLSVGFCGHDAECHGHSPVKAVADGISLSVKEAAMLVRVIDEFCDIYACDVDELLFASGGMETYNKMKAATQQESSNGK